MQSQQFKYYAFISYSSHDMEWGKRLQRKLEHYRMPATICSERGWERTPIKPVFFAPTDIQPGGLTEELQQRLQASRNLIVICSPHSARSEWVAKEIAYFHQLGRAKHIHFFIVDGQPHGGNPDTECFNPIVNTLGLPEILGANIHEKIYRWPWMNQERAYVQLISKLLDVEFDAIWQRHKRLFAQKVASWCVGVACVLAVLAGVWITNQPVDVEVQLNEASVHNPNLPPMQDAVVTMTFDNEVKTDTVSSFASPTLFRNIPHRYLNEPIQVKVVCRDYLDVDTTVLLSQRVALNLYRNPAVYGDVHFRVWDFEKECGVANVTVEIAGQTVRSDKDGRVSLFVPLASQQKTYHATASLPLVSNIIPMPSGDDDIIIVSRHR